MNTTILPSDSQKPIHPRSLHWLRWGVLFGSASVVLAIDQISKYWVTSTLGFGETWTPIPAIGDFFAITRSANSGAAFSLLPQAGDLFLIIALIMIVAIIYFYRQMLSARWIERIALGLLLGGVMGNAVDRIRLGYVVDFVHLQIKPFVSNVSNLADHAIVISIAILFVAQWFGKTPSTPETADKNNTPEG